MLLKITEKCSMGCSHCMNSATENGEHMSLDTFKDAIDFIIRNNAYHSIIVSGGEPTEHPMFPFFMGYLLGELTKRNLKSMVTIATNGFWILESEENMKCAKNIAAGYKDVKFQFQVSTDTRYYPKKLDTTKRIWREEGFFLYKDCVQHMYPQGRAKENGYPYQAVSSKCFNVRALAKQLPYPTIENVTMTLALNGKFCTPAIRIDGGISLGESDLCPKCASIYDKEEDIIQKIKNFKCSKCDFINEKLPTPLRRFVE